jgi:AcrR family transcriptional regulator
MRRIAKAYEDRKGEILDDAWECFSTLGYEKTTVALLLERLGIAKGTFYHYFDSKEAVLDGIAIRFAGEGLEKLQAVVEDPQLPAGPKLNRFIQVARNYRLQRLGIVVEVSRVLYREENLVIRDKISRRLLELGLPLLEAIIMQGMDEGCFRVTDARNTALFFWHLSNIFSDAQIRTLLGNAPLEEKVAELVGRAAFVTQSLDRVLGADPGTILNPPPQVLRQFALGFQRTSDAGNP